MLKIIILKLNVAGGREGEFEQMVAERARLHGNSAEFKRMYLLRPDSENPEFRVVAWLENLGSPEAWVRTETYALSEDRNHAGIVVGPVPHEVLQVVREF